MTFRRLELDNRKLENWDWRHREFSEIYDETLSRRALKLTKDVDELIIEEEQAELLRKAIVALHKIQRWRFLLYYEYEYNYYEIAAMEHCTAFSVGQIHYPCERESKGTDEKISLCLILRKD